MTKELALIDHRKMWNWIANQTEKRGLVMTKSDYLEDFYPNGPSIMHDCFCCEYTDKNRHLIDSYGKSRCTLCPIDWGDNTHVQTIPQYCERPRSPYTKWKECFANNDYEQAVKFAREIANLPERKAVKSVWIY